MTGIPESYTNKKSENRYWFWIWVVTMICFCITVSVSVKNDHAKTSENNNLKDSIGMLNIYLHSFQEENSFLRNQNGIK